MFVEIIPSILNNGSLYGLGIIHQYDIRKKPETIAHSLNKHKINLLRYQFAHIALNDYSNHAHPIAKKILHL